MARVWRDWGMHQFALGSAHRAAYYGSTSASAANTLGTVFAALGELGRARDAYQRAFSLDPGAAWALNNMCDAELRLGRLDEARARCEAALRIAPAFAAAHNNLGLVLAAAGDFAAAHRQFLAAGDRAAASYNLGMVHLAEGHYESAADAFVEAIRARPWFAAAKRRAHETRLRLLTGNK
jgi:tetratricopeptide (TPR) repeat protein